MALSSTSTLGGAAPKSVPNSYRWWALSCTSLGTLMATLNSGTLIIALPVLLRELHTDLLTLVWVLLAYNLAQTVLVLTAGRIADIIGRKTLYVTGFAAFGAMSLASGFCTTGTELIVVRALQGAAGAFMLANSSAIVTDAFPRRQLGVALGTNMIVAAVGSILGTILGGWLTSFGWQWVFWFNVPFAAVGTVWAIINLRELAQIESRQRFDILGTIGFVVAMVGLLIGLSAGGIQGWTSELVLIAFAVAAVTFPIFLITELRVQQPMINLKLFSHRPFALGNFAAFFNAMARMGVTFLFVFYFQGPKRDDPITAGLLLTPIALAMLLVSPISGVLADRFGSRWLSFTGLVLTTAGLVGMAFIDLNTAEWYIVLVMAIMGAGSGFFNSPNSRQIMTSVRPGQRGVAAGSRTMLANSGGVISIALTLAIVVSAVPTRLLFAIFAGVTSGLPTASLVTFVNGLHTAFWVMAGLSLISVLIALFPYREGEYVEQASTGGDLAALALEESEPVPALPIVEPGLDNVAHLYQNNHESDRAAAISPNFETIASTHAVGTQSNGRLLAIERPVSTLSIPTAHSALQQSENMATQIDWYHRYQEARQELENAVAGFLLSYPEYLPPGKQSAIRYTLELLDINQLRAIEDAMRQAIQADEQAK